MPPLTRLLKNRARCDATLIGSGQHREMLAQAFADFQLTPDISLDLMAPSQTLAGLSSRLLTALDDLFGRGQPDCVIIQGDTTTAMMAAIAAFYRGIKVAHVEAGLRSHNLAAPFPEEFNRKVAAIAAEWHFASTPRAAANLESENVPSRKIYVTGNTVIDALLWMREHGGAGSHALPEEAAKAKDRGKKIILMTGHRRENFGQGFDEIFAAVTRMARAFPEAAIIYPVHLNPRVHDIAVKKLAGMENISIIPPLSYKSMVALMDACHLVLTDSGGIQEEAPSLGKPVLVMREVTERQEGVEAGTARLVGAKEDAIFSAVEELLRDGAKYAAMATAVNPYGDGHASERIADILLENRAG